jgi:hypothetical protein
MRRHSGHAFQDATPGHTTYRGTLSNFAAGPMNVDSAEGEDADKEESLSDGISAHVGTPQRSTCPSVISRRRPQNESSPLTFAIRFAHWASSLALNFPILEIAAGFWKCRQPLAAASHCSPDVGFRTLFSPSFC